MIYLLDLNKLDVTPENASGQQQMPDLVLKTGDARVESEPAVVPEVSDEDDDDSWPSESSDDLSDEPGVTSSHPAPSKYSNREDVVCVLNLLYLMHYRCWGMIGVTPQLISTVFFRQAIPVSKSEEQGISYIPTNVVYDVLVCSRFIGKVNFACYPVI